MIKSKVIIFTEGGEKIGFGHITRCIALSQAIEDKGYASELIVNADDSILDFIEDRNYQIFDWITEQGKLTGLIKDADFVIIDSYLAEKRIYDKISKITDGNLLMIDDCCRLEYPRGIVVNPSIYGDKLNYPQKDRVTYLLGKDYIILRKEFWEVPHKKINIEIKNILITFGRVKCGNLIDRIANFFKDNFKFRVHIVGSDSNKLSAKPEFFCQIDLKRAACLPSGRHNCF
jgi:spore coat polysaccharide biosynthesis predicted glycosyltransferase SpsG